MGFKQVRNSKLPNFKRRGFLKRVAIMQAGISTGLFSHGKVNAQDSIADTVQALTFDVFGTVVDWRTSIIREGQILAANKGFDVNWGEFAEQWRGGYGPAMNRVRIFFL